MKKWEEEWETDRLKMEIVKVLEIDESNGGEGNAYYLPTYMLNFCGIEIAKKHRKEKVWHG